MKWLHVILLVLALMAPVVVRAQIVDDYTAEQQEKIARQGLPLRNIGVGMAWTGGASALVGGALIGLGYYAGTTSQSEENMAAAIFLSMGVACFAAGVIEVVTSVPFIVAGDAMNKCDDYWNNIYYLGTPQSGLGLILEGGFLMGAPAPCVQARIVPGFNVNQHLFVGIGAAPTMDFDKPNEDYSPFTLPVFADARYCFGNKLFAPYLGAGVGMETVYDPNIYFSLEGGLRVRLSQSSPRSFWVSALAETSAAYARMGIKMGYSF